IKGGVCYFLWDRDNAGKCLIETRTSNYVSSSERELLEEGCSTFIRYNEAIPILKKVRSKKEPVMSNIVSSLRPFGFRTYFKGKSELFPNSIKLYGNKAISYVSRVEITQNI